MQKQKEVKKSPNMALWFGLGLVAVLLASPNGTIIKSVIGDIGPELYNTLRFGLIFLLTLPFIITARHKFTRTNLRHAVLMGVFMVLAVLSYVMAVERAPASYVAVLELLMPIVFIGYSVLLTKEKITGHAMAGVSLAALGATIIVVMPIVMTHQAESLTFDPIATGLVAINVLTFPLAVIFSRKASDEGLPLITTFGVSSGVVFAVSFVTALLWADFSVLPGILGSPGAVVALLYTALVVSLLVRIMNVAVYRRIGAAAHGGFGYTESILAIIIPILILGEELSAEVIVGVMLILVGLFVIENNHQWKHRKHLHGHGVIHK